MSEKVKVAILGAGNVAKHYKTILKKIPDNLYEIVGICDIDEKVAALMASDFGCRHFNKIELLIHEMNPVLVIILTPSGLHFEHSKIALENGCHVIVEKPISNLPFEASTLKKIADKNKKMIVVAFQNRLNPAIQYLKKAIDNNRFGKIITSTIRLRWCRYQDYYNDGWHGTWALDGGVINQQAIHHVDVINWLMGPVTELCSAAGNRLNKLEAEDTLVSILKFNNGAFGTIEATTAARPIDYEASLSVVGEKGYAVIGGVALNRIEKWNFVEPIPEDENAQIRYSVDVPSGYGLSHETLLTKTFETIQKNEFCSPIELDSCINTCELIHALYSSNENRQWVKLIDKPISKFLGR